jgi:acetyl-CoA C-acetyltransferase
MRQAVIVGGVRSPIGSFGGSLRDVSAAELGGLVLREAQARARLESSQIDEVIMGCIGQVAEDAYIARRSAVMAGLPYSIPAFSVNRLCSSGLQAIVSAASAIHSHQAEVVLAGGTENMSQLPYYVRKGRWGLRLGHGTLEDGLLLALTDPFTNVHMGITAENVAERLGISREEQDLFAWKSQQKAAAAMAGGRFSDQILPISIPQPKGDPRVVAQDEYPRPDTTLDKLSSLKPAFKPGGTVTPGNSSGINDGAAAAVVMSQELASKLSYPEYYLIRSTAATGVDPALMGLGPITSIQKALKLAGLRSLSQIDLIELNEAFAVTTLAVLRELDIPEEKVNVNGGAIALGHPVGATGCILTVKLMAEMKRTGARLGLISLCVGGGQGLTAILERISS